MSGNTPPSDQPPPEGQRCPRCGGVARPHKRRAAWANPFLSKSKTEITCEDCGLDFDPAAPSADASRSSGQSPWSKS
ncbi:MAG: hypothetical protein QM820_09585 [Minicystis sp.]